MSPHIPINPALKRQFTDVTPITPAAARRRLPAALRHRQGLLAVSAGAVLWGTTGVVVRSVHAATGLSASAIGSYRLGVAALVLAAVRPRTVIRGLRAVLPQRGLVLASGVGLGMYQALYFFGVQEAGVSVATLVSLGVAPVVTTLAAAVARRRRPNSQALVVLVGALAGLVLVCLPGMQAGGGSGRATMGVLASLGSGTGYGVTVLLNRRMAGEGGALATTVATSTVGAAVLVPVAMVTGPWLVTEPGAAAWLVYLGTVCTALAYGLFYAGLRTTRGEVAVVVTMLEPLTATLLAVCLLGEPLSWPIVLGALLMLASIAGLYLRPRLLEQPLV